MNKSIIIISRMTPEQFLSKYPELTHADLAYILGVSVEAVHKWIQGKRFPGDQVCRHIAKINKEFERWQWDKEEKDNSPEYAIWLEKIAK